MIKRAVLVVTVMASGASAQPAPAPTAPPVFGPQPPPPSPSPPPTQDPSPPSQSYPPPQPYPPPEPYTQPPPQPYPQPSSYPQPMPSAPPTPPPHRDLCIEGRPVRCDVVFLLELGFRGGTTSIVTGDFGVMFNRGYDAWGLTFGFAAVERPGRVAGEPGTSQQLDSSAALMGRYRHYLSNDGFAFDLSAGGTVRNAIGEVALGYRDIIAITAGANTFESADGRTGVGTNVGIRLGTEGIGFLIWLLAEAAAK